jgi:hypothetical protein
MPSHRDRDSCAGIRVAVVAGLAVGAADHLVPVVVLISWWRHWAPIRSALRHATRLQLEADDGATDLVIMSSPLMPEPGVVGIQRPRLLLPEGIVEHLTPAQLRSLIAHERCHIRCHDNLVAAVHMVVEAIFWFHPVVWWIQARLVDERERACDEAVLRTGTRPQDYAEGILEVCRQSVGVRLACVAGVSGSNLRARVEAIMRSEIGRPMTPGRRWALALAAVTAVVAPVAGGALAVRSQIVVPPALSFDTATVARSNRPCPAEPGPLRLEASLMRHAMSRPGDGQFRMGGPVNTLIQAAYNVTGWQIEGSPDWVLTERYEIDARTSVDSTPDQNRSMLQSLLADRFHLVLRREIRTMPAYELAAADAGLRISPAKEERFNVVLDFAAAPDMDRIATSGPTIFAALQEQLGLQLMPADLPIEVLVIERIEPPGN